MNSVLALVLTGFVLVGCAATPVAPVTEVRGPLDDSPAVAVHPKKPVDTRHELDVIQQELRDTHDKVRELQTPDPR
jgi:hypothetical protein